MNTFDYYRCKNFRLILYLKYGGVGVTLHSSIVVSTVPGPVSTLSPRLACLEFDSKLGVVVVGTQDQR